MGSAWAERLTCVQRRFMRTAVAMTGPAVCCLEREGWVSVSVSVETRRSDDLYTGASPDGDGVEAERWPLLGGDGGRKEMGRGQLEVHYSWTTRGEPTWDGEVARYIDVWPHRITTTNKRKAEKVGDARRCNPLRVAIPAHAISKRRGSCSGTPRSCPVCCELCPLEGRKANNGIRSCIRHAGAFRLERARPRATHPHPSERAQYPTTRHAQPPCPPPPSMRRLGFPCRVLL